MTISSVILVKNEEATIKDCLNALKWCDELIVIDDMSEDRTAEIARKMGAKVYRHALHDNFSDQRNYGLARANSDWVLFIDSDERVSVDLQKEILRCIENLQITGYFMKRIDVMWQKKLLHGEMGSTSLLRLAKRESGEWKGVVHEEWHVEGLTDKMHFPLFHYPHQRLYQFLTEINYYTDLRAKELYEQQVGVSWVAILVYPVGKFIVNYFFKFGFMDGIQGLLVALIMSFHSFLVRGKLWQLGQKK